MSNPITYISGGFLGDFIHQLSVINEKYLETGRKGVLYITDKVGEMFRHGVQTAFQDTYPFIIKQVYIEDYKIHNGEPYDINLSQWRSSSLLFKTDWNSIFKHEYGVNWGAHPWLTINDPVSIPANVDGKVLFCCSTVRFPNYINFHKLFVTYGKENIIFITQNMNEYMIFMAQTGITLNLWMPSSLEEFITAIAKCSLYIGNLSSPLTYAYALHKKNVTLLPHNFRDNVHFFALSNILPTTVLQSN